MRRVDRLVVEQKSKYLELARIIPAVVVLQKHSVAGTPLTVAFVRLDLPFVLPVFAVIAATPHAHRSSRATKQNQSKREHFRRQIERWGSYLMAAAELHGRHFFRKARITTTTLLLLTTTLGSTLPSWATVLSDAIMNR